MSRAFGVSQLLPFWACVVLALGLPERARGSATLVAERAPAGGVRLSVVDGGVSTPLRSPIDGAAWRAFGLRVGGGRSPAERGAVIEVEGDLPRLSVRSESQWVAFDGPDGASGLARLHAGGVDVVLSAPDDRYRIEPEGACLSPGGEVLGLVLRGTLVEEAWLVGLLGPEPRAVRLAPPEPIRRVAPQSLSLSREAAFFAAELPEGDRSVYRACLQPLRSQAGPSELPARRIAGPFRELVTRFAASRGAVAFAAGSASDHLDVFVATEAGLARNVTSAEGDEGAGPIVPHSFESQHLAVSHDGRSVAYGVRLERSAELFVHDVSRPGPAGRSHITPDERFHPYIDQDSLIFFEERGRLVFVAGHDPVTSDVFGLDVTDPERPINLTRTGSGLEPPFLTKGTLSIGTIVEAGSLVIVSATGFSGTDSGGIVAVDPATGETVLELSVSEPSDYFSVGRGTYLTGSPEPGTRALYRIENRVAAEVGRAVPGRVPRRLALAPALALVAIPGHGLVVLRPEAEPETLSVAGAELPGDFTSAVLDPRGEAAVLARASAGGSVDHFALDLRALSIAPLFSAGAGTTIVGASLSDPGRFLRGDSNGDGALNVSDPIATLGYLFRGEAEPPCLDAADTDDDGEVALADAVRALLFLFSGGAPPPPPFPAPGSDPTADDVLGCRG